MAKEVKKLKKLVLLDAHAIIHRAYHALPDFNNSRGEPTGALYGIIAMLVNILKDIEPDYIAACFDLPKPTFRHKVYKEYKGGRKKSDDALVAQIIKSRDIFKTFNIPIYELEGYEADDVLGTIAKQMTQNNPDIQVIIASGDMDTMQLVDGDRVQVYTLKTGVKDTVLYNEDRVLERFKFVPQLLPDYKGLRGDPSDNIPGIQGIGEKTATNLISQYGELDAIYKKLDTYTQYEDGDKNKILKEKLKGIGLTPRLFNLLQEGKDEAYFSRMLATIKVDADVTYTIPTDTWVTTVDSLKIQALLLELEFRSLTPRVMKLIGADTANKAAKEVVIEKPSETELSEVTTILWLIKSDITNPTFDDVMHFTGAQSWADAKAQLLQTLKDRDLERVYLEIEKPLLPIVTKMNGAGILLDIPYFKKLSQEYHTELTRIEGIIYTLAGSEFNIKSPKQLGKVLFEDMKLPGGKKTATGQYSTNEKQLKKLADEYEIIKEVFAYRELQKILSTYVDNLQKMIADTGRLHTHFLPAGTTTGRLASQQPNLQNIPTKSEYGRRVRGGFIAKKGTVLVSIDYSQIELRIAAILSGDKKLLEIFRLGGDIHTAVASNVFNVSITEVTSEMRRRAKVINFGILYGMGVNALRENLQSGIPKDSDEVVTHKDARKYLDTYFESFAGLAEWIDGIKSETARLGYTQTLFGRKRYFDGLTSKLPFIRAAAERMAVNAPIQGTSADIVKLAMIAVDEYIVKNKKGSEVTLLLQVHDELIFEMVEATAQKDTDAIKEIMEHVVDEKLLLGVPLRADTVTGKNWMELK